MANPIDAAYDGLKALIAACPAFQTAVGAANATQALESIFWPDVKRWPTEVGESIPQRPFCLIHENDDCAWSMDVNLVRAVGELYVSFEFPATEADLRSQDCLRAFTTLIGQILIEMCVLAGTDSPAGPWYWHITRIEKKATPGLMVLAENEEPNEEDEAFLGASYKVSWI